LEKNPKNSYILGDGVVYNSKELSISTIGYIKNTNLRYTYIICSVTI
jgi:hypothetical protein